MFRVVYRGKFFNVEKSVESRRGKRIVLERIRGPDTVAVLPFLNRNKILMERQYRHPLGSYLLEIPAGHIEKGESPRHAALRELREETGYTAASLKYLFRGYAAPGSKTELTYYYAAYDLKKGSIDCDDDEIITLRGIDFNKALGMAKSGKLIDTKTIACILFYQIFLHAS